MLVWLNERKLVKVVINRTGVSFVNRRWFLVRYPFPSCGDTNGGTYENGIRMYKRLLSLSKPSEKRPTFLYIATKSLSLIGLALKLVNLDPPRGDLSTATSTAVPGRLN